MRNNAENPLPNAEVYIAGPLFNAEEREHNRKLADLYRQANYTVFNPLEDGINAAELTDMPYNELVRTVHEIDFKQVMDCTIFVANLNGAQVDDGTAAESGMAYVSKVGIPGESPTSDERSGVKVMIGYLNDSRSLLPHLRRNPLVEGSFDVIFDSREAIIDYSVKNFPPRNSAKVE